MDDIALAKHMGNEWVETTPEIIHHYNRNGLGERDVLGKKIPVRYFIFDGIKVCAQGDLDKILEEESTPVEVLVHGAQEGVVVGRK